MDNVKEVIEKHIKSLEEYQELHGVDKDLVPIIEALKYVLGENEKVEQLRVQLAGCGVIALGYDKNTKKGVYGWSQSFEDVRMLWNKYIKTLSKFTALREKTSVEKISYKIEANDVIDEALAGLGYEYEDRRKLYLEVAQKISEAILN